MMGLLPSPWLILALGVSLASSFGFGFYRGSTVTAATLHVEELRQTVALQKNEMAKRDAVIAEAQRQASATAAINEAATSRAESTEQYARRIEEKLHAFQIASAKGKSRPECRLTASDADGLRKLGQ